MAALDLFIGRHRPPQAGRRLVHSVLVNEQAAQEHFDLRAGRGQGQGLPREPLGLVRVAEVVLEPRLDETRLGVRARLGQAQPSGGRKIIARGLRSKLRQGVGRRPKSGRENKKQPQPAEEKSSGQRSRAGFCRSP